jgi:pimeloyl-ACP methyl ester carboxylesterase
MSHAEVRGRRVYYESHGPDSGPPLLLIMGMGGSCRGWLPLQVPDFSRARRTLIYEHRGVGESEDPGGSISSATLADDAAGLLDALEIERADVLGIFLGGMAAQELALRHPQRIRRMILAGTYARPDARRRLLLEQWRELARCEVPPEVMIRERLLWTLQEETLEQEDLITAMVEFLLRGGAPLDADLFVRQCDACLGHDTAERLGEIAPPTLVLCGRNDLLTPPHFHRELADGIPDAHLVTLPRSAHLLVLEATRAFNRTVLQFLGDEA